MKFKKYAYSYVQLLYYHGLVAIQFEVFRDIAFSGAALPAITGEGHARARVETLQQCWLLGGKEHTVNDVHDTIGRFDVGRRDLGSVNIHRAIPLHDVHLLALEGLHHLVFLEVPGVDRCTGNDVVFENGLELLDVFGVEQVGEGGLGQCSERLVGGSEDGEGAAAIEGCVELAGVEGRDEGVEVGSDSGELEDIEEWGRAWGRGGRLGQKHMVNDVHDAIGRVDVGRHDLSATDIHRTILCLHDVHLLTLEGRHHLGALEVLCVDSLTGDDVVFENGLELLDVLGIEQVDDGGFGQCSERLVGGSEDGEGAAGLEGCGELGGPEGIDEGGEVGSVSGELDDVRIASGIEAAVGAFAVGDPPDGDRLRQSRHHGEGSQEQQERSLALHDWICVDAGGP